MPPLLFAQALAEYGAAANFGLSMRMLWDRIVYQVTELDEVSIALIGGAVLLALVLFGRRSPIR